jgi:hypothetical protein
MQRKVWANIEGAGKANSKLGMKLSCEGQCVNMAWRAMHIEGSLSSLNFVHILYIENVSGVTFF